jgi:hypothetical protein
VVGDRLVTSPIPETEILRVPGTQTLTTGALANGSQIEVTVLCTVGSSFPTVGNVGIRTLGTADGTVYTEIGYDFSKAAFYADHSKCCAAPNTIVQRAPLPASVVAADGGLNMTFFVDGSLTEAFANGVVITPLISPDPAKAAPEDRVTTFVNSAGAGVKCAVESWQLKY